MELEDLKAAWKSLDDRLATSEAWTRDLARRVELGETRKTLRRLAAGQAVQAAIFLAVAVIAARFWVEHRATPHLLVMGAVLHAYAVLAIVLSARQLVLLAAVDFGAPVVALQRNLACLRRIRLRSQLWLGLPWWVLWVVATVVGARRLAGIDLYAAAPAWVHLSVAIGLVGIVLTLLVPRVLRRGPRGSRLLERLLDDAAGRSLARASRRLDELARFERS